MDFLGVGPVEILVVLVVAFLVFGPGKVSEVGRTLGKTMRTFRQASSNLTTQIMKEVAEEKAPPKPPDVRGDENRPAP